MKNKTRYVGLLLIGIMFLSSFGFAVINSVYNPDSQPTPTANGDNQIQVSRTVSREFTSQEQSYILRNGAVIIEFSKSPDCQNCAEDKNIIDGLAKKYNIFLSETASNATSINLIGKQTKQFSDITEKTLLNAYCEVAFSRPKECVLKDF